jgi:hypothetical protein
MATRNTRPADTTEPDPGPEVADRPEPEALPEFGGDLGKLLTQAQRTQRWFISNPGEDTPIPEGAYVSRGYPVNIAGLVVAIERVPSRFGPMPVYVLDVGRGPDFPLIRWGLTSETLRSAHQRQHVTVGDTIAATCPGLRDSRKVDPDTGRPYQYEDWRLLVQRGDGTVPAAGVGPSGDEEPF